SYERCLCALTPTRASADNAGAGQIYVNPAVVNPDIFANLQIHVVWDRTDAAHKWNEAFVIGQVGQYIVLSAGHERVDVRPLATDGTGKTIRSTDVFSQSPWAFDACSF